MKKNEHVLCIDFWDKTGFKHRFYTNSKDSSVLNAMRKINSNNIKNLSPFQYYLAKEQTVL
jgi:hypothetical protein